MVKTYRYTRKNELKDKKITFFKEEREKNEYGEYTGNVIDVPIFENVWAYVRQASTQEIANSKLAYDMNTSIQIETMFIINHREGIEYDMLIEFRGERYRIERIDEFDYSKKDMRIEASILR